MADNKYLKKNDVPEEESKTAIQPVAKASIKKKGFFRRTRDFLFSGDTKDVKEYIIEETVKPAIKDGIYEVFMNFIDGMIYGDSGSSRRRRKGSGGSRYEKSSYTSYYKTSNKYDKEDRRDRRSGPERLDLDCIEFDDDGPEIPRDRRRTGVEKANDVKAGMAARIERYSSGGSVQDVYDFCEISCPDWNATEWGWTDVEEFEKGCIIRRRRGGGGAELSLPPPHPLD